MRVFFGAGVGLSGAVLLVHPVAAHGGGKAEDPGKEGFQTLLGVGEGGLVDAVPEDGELAAAEPEGASRLRKFAQHVPDAGKQFVAVLHAVGLIDLLEAVHFKQQDGRAGPAERFQLLTEQVAVAQASQGVMMRMVFKGVDEAEALDGGAHELADGGQRDACLLHAVRRGIVHAQKAEQLAGDVQRLH